MVIITAPIKGFLPKIKGGNCHIPISQKTFHLEEKSKNLLHLKIHSKK